MRRIIKYSISLQLILLPLLIKVQAQDTILFPLTIKVGIEVSGPAIYFSEKNILSTEGYLAVDLNEKFAAVAGAGYLDYKFSQYNYEYFNKGIFGKAGFDFNLLKPDKGQGKYWAGVGLRYGLSGFYTEVPQFYRENKWGKVSSSIPTERNWAHFIELSPGVRAEVFKYFSIGWTINLRKLLYASGGKDLRPIYFPGYGKGDKTTSAGLSYFIVWNIPYKKKNVIIKKDIPEEAEETDETVITQ